MHARKLCSIVGFALAILIALGTPGLTEAAGIRIGSKNFTEQLILGELYGQALEARGIKVERKLNMGGTLIAHQALISNEIDLYPEYTGTALVNVLKAEVMTDAQAVFQKVKLYYEQQFKVTWLNQAPMNNTYVLAVPPEIAAKYNLKTLSDLAKVSKQLKIGTGPEWRDRKDGIPGLRAVYGMEFADHVQFAAPDLRYAALTNKQIDVVNAYATDGQIFAYKLALLDDDKKLWPPYHVAPVIRMQALAENPKAAEALNEVSALLDNATMSALNYRVIGSKEEPKDVARDFLKKKGILK